MGIKIEFEKNFDSYEQTIRLMGMLISNLNDMVEIEQAICDSRAIQSESVTALKNYIKDIHWGGFLNLIIGCYAEINRIMSSYMVGLQNLDMSVDAVVDEECLTNVEIRMKQLDDELYVFTENMKSKAESVSHIMQLPVKTGENISTGISAMAKEAIRVREDFVNYEERKKREVELYDELMSDMIAVGLGYLNERPNVLNYHRELDTFTGLFQIKAEYQTYYADVGYSQLQAKEDVERMQELLIVYENKRMSDKQIEYACKTAMSLACMWLPIVNTYGIMVFAASRIVFGVAAYYNVDQFVKTYDAGVLFENWDTDRMAEGLTDFSEDSVGETMYNATGLISTMIVEKCFTDFFTNSIENILEYEMLSTTVRDINKKCGKLHDHVDIFNLIHDVLPDYSKEIEEGTTYEKIGAAEGRIF